MEFGLAFLGNSVIICAKFAGDLVFKTSFWHFSFLLRTSREVASFGGYFKLWFVSATKSGLNEGVLLKTNLLVLITCNEVEFQF